MARFDLELPEDIMRDIEKIYNDSEQIFGEMTKAGADVVYKAVQASVPASFKDSDIMNCLKITRTYKTPSDDGINTKVGFYGYFTNEDGRKTPAPLVCNVFEYGNSVTGFKKPFFRRAFKKGEIEQAMFDAQKKASGGLLDE